MPCINWPAIRRLACALLVTALSSATCGSARAARNAVTIDDALTGKALIDRFDYVGKWQLVRGKNDGRTNGTSMRSTHTGDTMILSFRGTRVRIYGIRGPSGGRAGIALDAASVGHVPVDFYAPHVQTHALIYQSPVLPNGVHTISVVVWGTRNVRGRFYYVNIDGAEIDD